MPTGCWTARTSPRCTASSGRASSDSGEGPMAGLEAVEIKAFVPARDFALSMQFYQDLGFAIAWSDSDLAYLRVGDCSFLLQNFYEPRHAGNFMMHLLV